MTSLMFRTAGFATAFAFVIAMAVPAAASTDAIKRSVENLTQFPLDIALAPVVGGMSVYQNLQEIDDSPAVRIFYPIPGWGWNTIAQVGGGLLRGVSGIVEFFPGMVLLFTDAEMDTMFDPAEDNDALLEWETDYYYLKAGVNYTGG